jgi:hypothetical protein
LARNGHEDEAVRTYSEIVEFDPDNLASRQLLGDIYLGHGWYAPAYRQYRTITEAAPGDALAWLRLAAAAAGSGRVDEALRLERRVANAQGRPGPNDPRRWARLLSAGRLARLIAEPPKQHAPSRASLERKLKELQLFRGPATLVVLRWEDLSSRLALDARRGDEPVPLADITEAAEVGLFAAMAGREQFDGATLRAQLRSVPRDDVIAVLRHDIVWDGKRFEVKLTRHELPARKTEVQL